MKYDAHVFICTNVKSSGECCGAKGGKELRDSFKKTAQSLFPDKKIRVNAAGCLGCCEEGVAAVIYPQEKWLFKTNEAELAKNLEKALKNG